MTPTRTYLGKTFTVAAIHAQIGKCSPGELDHHSRRSMCPDIRRWCSEEITRRKATQ